MSILSRLARAASAYIRGRAATASSTRSRSLPPGNMRSIAGKPPVQRPVPPGGMRSTPGAPPIQYPPRPPITGNAPHGDDDDDEYDDVQLLGRDASYDRDDMERVNNKMRLVNSSNVYGYAFEMENERSGILYVTFLNYLPKSLGGDDTREGPGVTYAYYDFPLMKYKAFEAMAESTAGGAVWDFCRVRHSLHAHQHTYRAIQTQGEYVPRKVTADGFKSRAIASVGIGRRSFSRSQLKPIDFEKRRNGVPNRGTPNRGAPNRGDG